MKNHINFYALYFIIFALIACKKNEEPKVVNYSTEVDVSLKQKVKEDVVNKTSAEKMEKDRKEDYVITSEGIKNIKINQFVDESNKSLVPSELESGDGGYDGYDILGDAN